MGSIHPYFVQCEPVGPDCLNGLNELVEFGGPTHVAACTGEVAIADFGLVRERAEDHDWNQSGLFLFPNSDQDLGDAHAVYGRAEQHQLGVRSAAVTGEEVFEGLRTVVGDVDCVRKSYAAQGIDNEAFVVGVVFDEQHVWSIGDQR